MYHKITWSDDSMTVSETQFADRHIAITLHDGKRMVARTRWVRATGEYIVVGCGLSLLDKKPHPTAPNAFGIADPSRMVVKNAREARAAIQRLAETGRKVK